VSASLNATNELFVVYPCIRAKQFAI